MHGEALIIFDDHSEAGSFTTTLANTAHDVARCVLGVVTLSASPYTQSGLYSKPELQDFVRELLDKRGWAEDIAQFQAHEPDEKPAALTPSEYFDRELRHMGMSIDTLTTYEALVVAALLIDVNQTEEVQTFKALNPAEHGAVAKGESASDLISSEPKSAAEIVTQLMYLLPGSRNEA